MDNTCMYMYIYILTIFSIIIYIVYATYHLLSYYSTTVFSFIIIMQLIIQPLYLILGKFAIIDHAVIL